MRHYLYMVLVDMQQLQRLPQGSVCPPPLGWVSCRSWSWPWSLCQLCHRSRSHCRDHRSRESSLHQFHLKATIGWNAHQLIIDNCILLEEGLCNPSFFSSNLFHLRYCKSAISYWLDNFNVCSHHRLDKYVLSRCLSDKRPRLWHCNCSHLSKRELQLCLSTYKQEKKSSVKH